MAVMFFVTSGIDGDTFRVSPQWGYHGRTRDIIRIADFMLLSFIHQEVHRQS